MFNVSTSVALDATFARALVVAVAAAQGFSSQSPMMGLQGGRWGQTIRKSSHRHVPFFFSGVHGCGSRQASWTAQEP